MNNKKIKKAFSMVELIFVIVILGILAGVAVPKLMGTREDAYIAKGKNQIASIKNGINMIGSKNLLSGGCSSSSRYPDDLNDSQVNNSNYDQEGTPLFGGVLKEAIRSSNSNGGWMMTNSILDKVFTTEKYTYYINKSSSKQVVFTYDNTNGTFSCTVSSVGDDCDKLTK